MYDSKCKLPPFKGSLLDYHLQLLVPAECRKDQVTGLDALWIQEHFPAFNSLAAESESFRFALEAFVDCRFAKEARTAIARLWSGIEAMLGIDSELVYRISLVAASLLEARGDARKRRFEEIKKLYGLRSKAVHGDKLPEDKVSFALGGARDLLGELILWAISTGHELGPKDFDDAVFY